MVEKNNLNQDSLSHSPILWKFIVSRDEAGVVNLALIKVSGILQVVSYLGI